nr:arsenic metallochaperone ArsD family protein [Lacticaseibacillus baoqingensis]
MGWLTCSCNLRLPITMVNGIIFKQRDYPTFQEFSDYLHQDLSRAFVR